jgi:O-antigen/teichoic acid export membrane protein
MKGVRIPLERLRDSGLLAQILHYTLAAAFIRGVQVLTTPVITRLLPPGEYGYSVVFVQSVNLIAGVAVLGTATSMSQVYLKRPQDFPDTVKSVLLFVIGVNLVALPFLFLLVPGVADFFALPRRVFDYALPLGAALGIYTLFQSTLTAAKRSIEINRYTILNFTGAGLLFIVFLLLGERTWIARAHSYSIIVLLLFLATLRGFWPYLRAGAFRGEQLGYALRFGVPTIFAGISYVLFTYADRILLTRYRDPQEMGLYSFACVIGLLPLLVSHAAVTAFMPHFYDSLRDGDHDRIRRRSLRLTAGVVVTCITVSLAAQPLARIFAGADYHGALPAVPILALYSFSHFTLARAVLDVLYHEGTRFLSLTWIGAALLNIGLNVVFIPQHGYMAAAWTTLVTGSLHALVTALWVRWRYGVRQGGNVWNLAILVAAGLVLALWMSRGA